MLRRTRSDVGRELPPLQKFHITVDADNSALNQVSDRCAELARLILRGQDVNRGDTMRASEEMSNILRQATGIAKVRSGKLMAYNERTGKRKKLPNLTWIHTELAKSGRTIKDFNLEQCFFGEHLVTKETDGTIAIVEAEKTAVIARLVFPKIIWLASGGKSNLQIEKLKRLGERKIILYPDGDAFERWNKIAEQGKSKGINIKISSLIEKNGSLKDKENGKDLADYLIQSKGFCSSKDGFDKIYANKTFREEFQKRRDEIIANLQKEHNLSFDKAEDIFFREKLIYKLINEILGTNFEFYSDE